MDIAKDCRIGRLTGTRQDSRTKTGSLHKRNKRSFLTLASDDIRSVQGWSSAVVMKKTHHVTLPTIIPSEMAKTLSKSFSSPVRSLPLCQKPKLKPGFWQLELLVVARLGHGQPSCDPWSDPRASASCAGGPGPRGASRGLLPSCPVTSDPGPVTTCSLAPWHQTRWLSLSLL